AALRTQRCPSSSSAKRCVSPSSCSLRPVTPSALAMPSGPVYIESSSPVTVTTSPDGSWYPMTFEASSRSSVRVRRCRCVEESSPLAMCAASQKTIRDELPEPLACARAALDRHVDQSSMLRAREHAQASNDGHLLRLGKLQAL